MLCSSTKPTKSISETRFRFMAIEAQHMNLLPSRLIRDFKVNGRMLNTQIDSGLNFPAAMSSDNLVPLYQSSVCVPVKTTDSGLTYHVPAASIQRKRPRDDPNNNLRVPQKNKLSSFIDDELILQIQQHQSEIDRVIAQHAEKVRMELEERRKQESRMLVQELYMGIQKKLQEKDEEMQRMGKLNWVLQERVKSLYVENQIWRDLAHSNEATANSLRANLEHLLAQDRHGGDAESCCGSSAGDDDVAAERKCRRCGVGEACVLVLPCRHLSLCTACGSTVRACPVCDSPMNASVHVNMS